MNNKYYEKWTRNIYMRAKNVNFLIDCQLIKFSILECIQLLKHNIQYELNIILLLQMSWVDYFKNATLLVGKKVNSKTNIVNYAPEYFIKLNKLMQEYSNTTEGKVYVNYT